jgi:hypothetical protein
LIARPVAGEGAAGDGVAAGGEGLPATGNCPPPAEAGLALFDPPLWGGLSPASVRAPAKDGDLASAIDAGAAAGALADRLRGAASVLGGI